MLPVISTGLVYSPGSISVTPPTTWVAGLTCMDSDGQEMSVVAFNGLAGAPTTERGSTIWARELSMLL